MAIFNSYVKLPEGIFHGMNPPISPMYQGVFAGGLKKDQTTFGGLAFVKI